MKCKLIAKMICDEQDGIEALINEWLADNSAIDVKDIKIIPVSNNGFLLRVFVFIFYNETKTSSYFNKEKNDGKEV